MKSKHLFILTASLLAIGRLNGYAAGKEIINVSASPHVKFRTIGLGDARWTGGFWGERWEQDYRVTIPTMKQVMELPALLHRTCCACGYIRQSSATQVLVGSGVVLRHGFAHLTQEVALGRVGIILCSEASRLTNTSRPGIQRSKRRSRSRPHPARHRHTGDAPCR